MGCCRVAIGLLGWALASVMRVLILLSILRYVGWSWLLIKSHNWSPWLAGVS